ncbi:F0F1 ATP synthase subunit delta [Sphingobacterium deserti]|uniref:ATP synthase subunit delta n=1 Tax=Sphingobacterium deserti TaxID=1229276 RepID=A0A0B8TB75_9SPHI|nr:F0F1 ATP synthase subunit delta [Sphingobacterium deserti]KGE15400.1 ATP synthase subunit delta [Sphingobacterium deserti]
MSIFTVASRYAKSLLELAQEQGNLDAVKADIDQIVVVLKSNTEIQTVLKNPIISADKKRSILQALFNGKVNPLIVSFFNILVSKGRGDILVDIAQEFIREYNQLKGIVNATVISATKLSEKNLNDLQAKISQEINAQVLLKNKVDASVIGGFKLLVGDRQIDATIAGKLNKLEKYFVSQGV